MISYAQNAEDVVLARAFKGQDSGFYIDVGAADPTIDSVTRHFYDKGWRGINIDPLPLWHRLLEEARPEDVNLGVGISSEPGEMPLFVGADHPGGATLSAGQRQAYAASGVALETVTVTLTTLAAVCEKWVGELQVDFLKIDVEGHELAVIKGADWNRWRPRIVVVEATEPNSPTPSSTEWAQVLVEAGYVETLFDGLNRFYVRREDQALAEKLSAPANVFDDYVPYSLALKSDAALKETRQELEVARAQLRELQDRGRPPAVATVSAPQEEMPVADYAFDRAGTESGRAGRLVKPLRRALRRLQRPWFDRQVEIMYELRHLLDIHEEQLQMLRHETDVLQDEVGDLKAAMGAADARHWDQQAVAHRLAALEDLVEDGPTRKG